LTTRFSNAPQAVEVVQLLLRSTHCVQQQYEAQLAALDLPFPISGPRLRLLLAVWKAEPIRMNELAGKLGVKARTITDLVDALERDGLLMRSPDPNDRRATLLRLTEEAAPHIENVKRIQKDISEALLGHLTPEQQGQLFGLLSLLVGESEVHFVC